MELQVDFTGSNNRSPLVKHKRAKRKTPCTLSPVTSTSSTGGESCLPIPSPTSSANYNSTATKQEDEDMANCLILLAQGVQKSDYDCKPCNRTFPSFQALGGHRANHNHKKPKSDQEEEEKQETKPKTNKTIIISPPLIPFHSETRKAHGCSICGVVFSSGQALGGHMRRHRAPPATPPATPPTSTGDDQPRKFMSLDLDLNLPAPFEDDFEFVVASKKRFVMSGPALVDCYY